MRRGLQLHRLPETRAARHGRQRALARLRAGVRGAIGGWEIAGILSMRSGEPLTLTQPCASEWHCRPDHVGSGLQPTLDNWRNNNTTRCVVGARCSVLYINRAAFTPVPLDPNTRIAIRAGNVANGYLRNPATWTTDLSLSKNWRIREGLNLQIRADMFNGMNRVNYGGPTTDINSATFGEINGAGGMRVVQLNSRFTW
jgi:hypothetical protein